MKIQDIGYMSISLALVIICSKITFNIGPIPITLQTFAVLFVGLFLKTKRAFIVFLCYIIMGLAGIPVFSNGGGPAYILQPSFGFIIGFMLSVFITGSNAFKRYKSAFFGKAILGLLALDVIGLAYMALILNGYKHLGVSFFYVLEIGFTPFILKDCFSAVLAAMVYLRLRNVVSVKSVEDYEAYPREEKQNV